MTRRRFIADTWTPTTATLTGDQAAHLARVLRATPGQTYDIVANGFLHRAEITSVSAGGNGNEAEVLFTLHEELESESTLPLHLLLAVFKFDHLEWAIEKATELGVSKITPILARRTEKHLAQSALKRAERWRRIALEASKQSRRTTIPEIADPTHLNPALTQETAPTKILLSETEQSTSLTAALENSPDDKKRSRHSRPEPVEGEESPHFAFATHAIAIGPEGGWTPEEMSLFTQHHWQPVTLGPRILRAETAAIAAIAVASTYLT
jgi:16S rRNA (uracil1498-N3)-methyltransferase